jgi:DNA-binding NarL/FixJ family response regulator
MIDVMIAAASMALRVGLRSMLQEAAEAGNLQIRIEATRLEAPLPDVDVILAAGELSVAIPSNSREDLPGLLVLARDAEEARATLRAWPGALWGVLHENSTGAELAAALVALAQGLRVGSPALLENLIAGRAGNQDHSMDGEALTGREREVLQHLAQGLANKQIAIALGISEHTVKFHISAIYTKLGVNNRTEAVRAGVKQGLIAL